MSVHCTYMVCTMKGINMYVHRSDVYVLCTLFRRASVCTSINTVTYIRVLNLINMYIQSIALLKTIRKAVQEHLGGTVIKCVVLMYNICTCLYNVWTCLYNVYMYHICTCLYIVCTCIYNVCTCATHVHCMYMYIQCMYMVSRFTTLTSYLNRF